MTDKCNTFYNKIFLVTLYSDLTMYKAIEVIIETTIYSEP